MVETEVEDAAGQAANGSEVPEPAQDRLRRQEELAAGGQDRPGYPTYRVPPGGGFRLAELDPEESEHYTGQDELYAEMERQRERLDDLQEKLLAEEEQAVLVVLQAIDAGGKDGVPRGVFKGLNPQGVNVWSFSEPTEEEKKHDFLWRFHTKVPAAGMIGLFDRSYYEAVLSDRVKQRVPEEVWRARYYQINEFERILTLNNVTVLKFFMHISRDEQKRRLEDRLNNPAKQWLFSPNDVEERGRWDANQAAFEEMLNRCSTTYAPWYAVPANNKWFRNLVIARTVADAIEALDPQYPPLEEEAQGIEIPD